MPGHRIKLHLGHGLHYKGVCITHFLTLTLTPGPTPRASTPPSIVMTTSSPDVVRLPMSIVMAASSSFVFRCRSSWRRRHPTSFVFRSSPDIVVFRHRSSSWWWSSVRRLSTSIVVMVDVDFDVDIFYSVVWYVAAGKQGRTSMMSLAYGALETTSQYNFSIICLSNGYIWLLSLST